MFTEAMSIGEKLMNSLGVTVIGMGVVFSVLIILSYSLDILRKLTNKKKTQEPIQNPIEEKVVQKEDEEEIIAVITAAIAASLGKTTDKLIIRNIRRVPDTTPIWASAGRKETTLK